MKKTILYLFLLTAGVIAAFKLLEVSTLDAQEHREYRQEQDRLDEHEAAIQYLKVYDHE
jgi:hypothetical protein